MTINQNFRPIVSVGDLVADVIVSIPRLPAQAGQHQVANDVRLEPGGGANFLIAGARLGAQMAAIGVLGDDDWGRRVAALTRAEGVDMSAVAHSGTTTTVIVLVGQAGGHVFLGKYGHGPTLSLTPQAADLAARGGALYVAGYTLREARLADLALDTMKIARQAGVPVCFDPGPQMADVPPTVWAAALPLVDVLLATEDELPLLAPGGDIAALLAAGPRTVVVKRGGAGCAVYHGSPAEAAVEMAGHPVPVVDTSAAGDSFNAGFLVELRRGWTVTACARLANAVGAAKVQKLGGGRSVPTRAQVQAVLAQFGVSLPEEL